MVHQCRGFDPERQQFGAIARHHSICRRTRRAGTDCPRVGRGRDDRRFGQVEPPSISVGRYFIASPDAKLT
jgi:hypothetical protein